MPPNNPTTHIPGMVKIPGITGAVYTITPETARYILDHHVRLKNRGLSQHHVRKLAGAMSRGEWRVTGVGLVFDNTGGLIDGQHRLNAIIASGSTINIMVTFGVDPEARLVLDTGGKSRTSTDVLQLEGHKYAAVLGGAVIWYSRLLEGPKALRREDRLSVAQTRKVLDEYPALASWSETLNQIGLPRQVKVTSSLVALATAFEEATDEATTLAFFEALASGAGLQLGDPVLQLREIYAYLRDQQSRRSNHAAQRIPAWVGVALTIKAWNYKVGSERVQVLCLRSGERFPAINKWAPSQAWPKDHLIMDSGFRIKLSSSGRG